VTSPSSVTPPTWFSTSKHPSHPYLQTLFCLVVSLSPLFSLTFIIIIILLVLSFSVSTQHLPYLPRCMTFCSVLFTGGGGHLPPTVTIPTVARAPRITAGDPPFGMQPGSPCAFAEFFFQAFCHRDLSLSSSPSSPSSGFSPADRFRFETCVYLSVHECGFVFAASFYQLVIVLSTWSSQKNYFWICMYTKSATPVVHEYSHCRYLFSLNSIVCVGQLFLAKQTAVEAALFKFSKRV